MGTILTDTQRAAVNSTARETAVVCGAGSGKTTILTHRVAKLLSDGVSPHDIMVLTFTRKAANEMIERINALTDSDITKTSMMIGTFHAVALAVVRNEGSAIGYDGERLTVVDPDDASMLLNQTAADLGYIKAGTWRAGVTAGRLKAFLDGYYNTGKWPRTDPSQHGTAKNVDIDLRRIVCDYHVTLKRMNLLDFGTLLVACHYLLSFKGIRERWNDRVKHVLVDEVQDTDEIQYDIHRFFAPPATLFVVGDRRQSIYGFRGARPDLFHEQYRHAETITVPECFRSTPEIVGVANRLYAAGRDKDAVEMIAVRPSGKPVTVMTGRSRNIVQAIEDHLAAGFEPTEIAVLARGHRTLKRIAGVIDEINATRAIPDTLAYRRIGASFDICDTEEFRRLRAALRLCVNPKDDLAFLRLASNEFGLMPDELAEVRARAADGGGLFDAWFGPVVGDMRFVRSQLNVGNLAMTIASHDVSKSLKATAWSIAESMTCPGPAPYRRVAYWWHTMYGGTVQNALLSLSLRDSQSDMPGPGDKNDRVTLATIHAAKGLEWPCVILAEANEGSLPSGQAIARSRADRTAAAQEAIEEERRVAYVAVTRACVSLTIHHRSPADCDPKRKPAVPSRFIADMGVVANA